MLTRLISSARFQRVAAHFRSLTPASRPLAAIPLDRFEQSAAPPAASVQNSARTLGGLLEQPDKAPALSFIRGELDRLEHGNLETLEPACALEEVERLYLFQEGLLGTCNRLSLRDEGEVKMQALELLHRIGGLQTRVFRRAVALSDEVPAWVLYRNTLKTPGFHSDAALREAFLKDLGKFLSQGGDLSSIQPVTRDFLLGLRDGELAEWAVDDLDSARIASAEGVRPGHFLLAWGRDVLGAGSLRVFKTPEGQLAQVYVGSFSGRFRSGLESQAAMARHLVAAGVPPEIIICHESEAAGNRTAELLNRLVGTDGAEAQREVGVAVDAFCARWGARDAAPQTSAPTSPFFPRALLRSGSPGEVARLKASQGLLRQELGQGVDPRASSVTAERTARLLEEVLARANDLGDAKAYGEALAALNGLLGNSEPLNSHPALMAIRNRWRNHRPGNSSRDPLSAISAAPLSGRRVRVIATVASDLDATGIARVLESGADVLRLAPGSSQQTAREFAARARAVAAELGRPVSLLAVGKPGGLSNSASLGSGFDLLEVPMSSSADLISTLQSLPASSRPRLLPRISSVDGIHAMGSLAPFADGFILDWPALHQSAGTRGVFDAEKLFHLQARDLGKPEIVTGGLFPSLTQSAELSPTDLLALSRALNQGGLGAVSLEWAADPALAVRALIGGVDASENQIFGELQAPATYP